MAIRTFTTELLSSRTTVNEVQAPVIASVEIANSNYNNGLAQLGVAPGQHVFVNIIGRNFFPNASVRFNNVEMSNVAVVTDELIRASFTAPSTLNSYLLSVTNTDGEFGTFEGGFKVSLAPTVSSNASVDVTLAVGTDVSTNLLTNFQSDSNIELVEVDGLGSIPGTVTLASNGLVTANVQEFGSNVYRANVRVRDAELQYSNTIPLIFAKASIEHQPNVAFMLDGDTIGSIADKTSNSALFFSTQVVGATRISDFNPYEGGWSVAFDDTGDYLTINNVALLPTDTSDWTAECWFRVENVSSDRTIFYLGGNTNSYAALRLLITTASNLALLVTDQDGSWDINTTVSAVVLNQWYHVAAVRQNNILKIYVNGELKYTSGAIGALLNGTQNHIGSIYFSGSPASQPFAGYISNARIVKGRAIYTGDFIPSREPLQPVAGTVLLACQSNRIIDNSISQNTITIGGDAKVVDASPFENRFRSNTVSTSNSVYFDGNGDFLTITANSALDFGTGNFTFETWIFIPSGGSGAGQLLTLQPTSGSNFFQWFVGNSDGSTAWGINNVGNFNTSGAIPLGSWTHLALTREGNTLRQFTNGSKTYENTNFTYTIGSSNQNAFIGRDTGAYNNYLNAVLSNFRIVKGTAVYTSAFTPPTSPLTAISGTSLLTCQSDTLIDKSTNNFTITPNGQSQLTRFNPFDLNGYREGYYSTYFDGSNDSLTLTTGNDFVLGTDDFTMECWFNTPSLATERPIFYKFVTWATNMDFFMRVNANGSVTVGAGDSSPVNIVTAASVIQINKWYHLAFTRSGSTFRLFINGVLFGTDVETTSIPNDSTTLRIGWDGSTNRWSGYLYDVRIVKGTCLYTNGFTPPTEPLETITGTILHTCQRSTITDLSSIGSTITNNGGAVAAAANPFNNSSAFDVQSPIALEYKAPNRYGSIALDGTDDYVTLPSGWGTLPQEFTMETWIYPRTPSATYYAALSASTIIWQAGPGVRFGVQGTWYTNQGDALQANSWNHVAVTRDTSDTIRLFVNGRMQTSTGTNSTLYNIGSLKIGEDINGYLSDFSILANCKYRASFIVPEVPESLSSNALLRIIDNKFESNTAIGVVDSSINKLRLDRGGAPALTPFSPFWNGGWSAYFDGTQASVNLPSVASGWTLSGDFTIECWVYPLASKAGGWGIIDARQSGATASPWVIGVSSSKLAFFNGTSYNGTNNVPLNRWSHIVWCRSGSTMRYYINGQLDSTHTLSGAIAPSYNTAVRIGSKDDGINADYRGDGYISNLRLVNGTALYTSSTITVPTAPLEVIENTSLLIFRDNHHENSARRNWKQSNTWVSGNVYVRPVSPFAPPTLFEPPADSGSLYFNNGYLNFTSAAGIIGNSSYSIEYWYYPVGNPTFNPMTVQGTTSGYDPRHSNTQYVVESKLSTSQRILVDPGFVANTWHHVVVTKNNGYHALFVNGVRLFYDVNTASYAAGGQTPAYILGTTGQAYISNFRILQGTNTTTVQLYDPGQTTLAIPVSPPAVVETANTKVHLAGDFGDTTFASLYGTSPYSKTGNVSWSSFSPFAPRANSNVNIHTPAEFGGSMFFTGTDNIRTEASTHDDVFGTASLTSTASFTIEAWVYVVSRHTNSTWGVVIGDMDPDGGTNYWSFGTSSTGRTQFYWYDGTAKSVSGDTTVPTNSWSHIALSVQSGTIRMFVNGIQQTLTGTTTLTSTSGSLGRLAIGESASGGSNLGYHGYISDIKVSRGAIYTTSFSPPYRPATLSDPKTLHLKFDNPVAIDRKGHYSMYPVGYAQARTAEKKYGDGSLYFEGTGSWYRVNVPLGTNDPNWAWELRDFTFECWAKWASTNSGYIIDARTAAVTGGWALYVLSSGTQMVWDDGATSYSMHPTGGFSPINTWYHIAICRANGTTRFFVNGVETRASVDQSSRSYTAGLSATVGARYSDSDALNGYIDDLRISTYAKYTEAFTPPTRIFREDPTSILTIDYQNQTANEPLAISGGTQSTSGIYTLHTFTTPGESSFTVTGGSGTVEILAVGAGGGGGGVDGGIGGAGGGSGAITVGTFAVTGGATYTVYVGGRGGGGSNQVTGTGGGAAGTNGGGAGGNAGGSGSSGGGGGGGGWSGVALASSYLLVAGGGSGGGGSNEGSANDVASAGGGVQNNGANGTSLFGAAGSAYSGDGGGWAGGGGGYYGGAGQNTSTGACSGGGVLNNGTSVTTVNGNAGQTAGGGGNGGAAATISWDGYAGGYGAGGNGSTAGANGIVIVRYTI